MDFVKCVEKRIILKSMAVGWKFKKNIFLVRNILFRILWDGSCTDGFHDYGSGGKLSAPLVPWWARPSALQWGESGGRAGNCTRSCTNETIFLHLPVGLYFIIETKFSTRIYFLPLKQLHLFYSQGIIAAYIFPTFAIFYHFTFQFLLFFLFHFPSFSPLLYKGSLLNNTVLFLNSIHKKRNFYQDCLKETYKLMDRLASVADPDPQGSVSFSRIRIWDPFLGVLGSGSVSYSHEHNKINWKENFNKVSLLVGSCWTYWQGKSS